MINRQYDFLHTGNDDAIENRQGGVRVTDRCLSSDVKEAAGAASFFGINAGKVLRLQLLRQIRQRPQ